jgi:hypothetical protein
MEQALRTKWSRNGRCPFRQKGSNRIFDEHRLEMDLIVDAIQKEGYEVQGKQ